VIAFSIAIDHSRIDQLHNKPISRILRAR